MMSNSTDLCDTIFVCGPEKKKMYGLRALLANISPVFKAQLFGSFKEAQSDSLIEYPTIASPVFACILRVSFGLDPCITEHTAVPLIEASNMLQIEALQHECQYFLKHCINDSNVLFLLNSAYSLSSLDRTLYRKCRSIILQSSPMRLLNNEGFLTLHPNLIIDIIQSDDFKAKEEEIWNAIIKWAQHVHQKNVRFPRKRQRILKQLKAEEIENENDDDDDYDDDDKEDDEKEENEATQERMSKTLGGEDDDGDENAYDIKQILKPITPYIRFPLMSKTFFIEHVCKYLSREQSESVLVHYILGKASVFNHDVRKAFISFAVIAASRELESAQKLPDTTQDSLWCSQKISDKSETQWLIMDVMLQSMIKSMEVKNRYSDKDTIKTFKLEISSHSASYSENEESWIDVQTFQSAKSSAWQHFNVDHNRLNDRKSRYWRLVVIDTYGGYSCLNHLRLNLQF